MPADDASAFLEYDLIAACEYGAQDPWEIDCALNRPQVERIADDDDPLRRKFELVGGVEEGLRVRLQVRRGVAADDGIEHRDQGEVAQDGERRGDQLVGDDAEAEAHAESYNFV